MQPRQAVVCSVSSTACCLCLEHPRIGGQIHPQHTTHAPWQGLVNNNNPNEIRKALAMGAESVLVGRATLYGVCAGGEAGALRALEILRDEFMRSMQLCGARTVADIGPDLIAAADTV